MPHFKDQDGGLHYLSEADIANGGEIYLPQGCIEIADEEAFAIQSPTVSQLWVNYQATAQVDLDKSSVTIERIVEGVALGSCAWKNADVVAFMNYRKDLRAIVAAKSGDPTQPLPTRPDYPVGT